MTDHGGDMTGTAQDAAGEGVVNAKPTVAALGIDIGAQDWLRSGPGEGAIEVAFVAGAADSGTEWVLMRLSGDAEGRVLVYDRNEWECFLDGVRGGEFDDAAG
jgi:Domain of unknown function (DUF397)